MSAAPVGTSAAAKELRSALQRVAASPRSTLLIEAERGAPVAELARLIHESSPRSSFAFEVLDGAELDANELRAAAARVDRGTLLVDDLEHLTETTQAAVLALLRPSAGAPPPLRVMARISCDVEELVRRGTLREDLLYRLNGLALRVPPLRERREDLSALAAAHGARAWSADARAALESHAWPGNERELELVVARATLLAGNGRIEREHLALASAPTGERTSADTFVVRERSWRAVEEALIRRVLDEEHGNKSRAASVLGLHRATLHHKLRAYRIGT